MDDVEVFKDKWGRVTKRVFIDGWISYEYDGRGNLIHEYNSDNEWSKKYYNEDNLCIREEYNDGLWRESDYDSVGRVISFSDSLGNTQKVVYNELDQVVVSQSNGDTYHNEYDIIGRHTKIITTDGKWVSMEYGDVVYDLDKTILNNPEDGLRGLIYLHTKDGYWKVFNREGGVIIKSFESKINDNFYIEYARASYSHWTDDMFDKYRHLVNWDILSYLPRLSYYVIDRFSDKLNMRVVNFFRGVWKV